MSRRGDRAECRRCARLPAPSSASPFADAVADAALVRVPPAETKRRASFALGRSKGARVSPLTARALAQKAREEGDALDASDSDEDWRSARSAQTTRSWVTATGRDASETDDAFSCETFDTSPDLRDFSFAADEAFSSSRRDPSRGAPSLARAQPGAPTPARASSGRGDACEQTVRGTRGRGEVSENENDTNAAFAALERATADFEDDALEEIDTNATRTKRNGPTKNGPGSWRFPLGGSRLAKIGEGARMVSAVRAAMRKAGGVLDLTAFKGTPIKWHAPHSALLAHARGESTLKRHRRVGETARATRRRFVGTPDDKDEENGGGLDVCAKESDDIFARFDVDGVVEASDDWLARRPPRAARLFTSLFWSFGNPRGWHDIGPTRSVGTEVRASEVFLNSVSSRAARLAPAHRRMLAVAAAVLADCEPPALFRKPFNPVLGETARHELRFVDGSSVASVLEQVSHHPPVTAFHSKHRRGDVGDNVGDDGGETNCGFAAFGHFRPRPSLRGFPFAGKVHIDIEGTRTFRVFVHERDSRTLGAGSSLGENGGDGDVVVEDYVSNYVGFEWLFFPAPRARTRAGETHVVRCARTGLVAQIEHIGGGSGSEVRGTVYEEPTRETLHAVDVDGRHDDASDRVAASARRNKTQTRKTKEKEKKNSLGTPLFAIGGAVNARVVATCLRTNETFVLYDADVAAVREAESVAKDVAFDLDTDTDPRGSFSVWRFVTSAMREKKWDDARRGKTRVEADERRKRAARDFVFEPRFFERDETRDTWVLRADVASRSGEPRRAPSGRGGGRREGDAAR